MRIVASRMVNKFAYFGCILTCALTTGLVAQDQRIADSLKHIYQQDTLKDKAKLELLKELSFNEIRDLKKALLYTDELISLAKEQEDKRYLQSGYFIKGNKEIVLTNMKEALSALITSAELAKEMNSVVKEGESYLAIADIYSNTGNHNTSTHYYVKAIHLLRMANDSISLASAFLNAGDEYLKAKKYDTALSYALNAKAIFDTLRHQSGKGYSRGNIGMVYASTGKHRLAEKYLKEGISILEANEDYNASCDYLLSMSDVYLNKGEKTEALNHALRSLELAKQYGLNQQVINANLKVSDIYGEIGNTIESLKFYKAHIAGRDSVNNLQTVQELADLRTNYEVSQKQIEVDLLNQQKRNQRSVMISLAVILILALVIASILFKYNRQKKKAYEVLNLQKQATEEQKIKAENALSELKAIQRQMIHTAKMASLGEVMAGIAHEIQNPLNFVTNFSELNMEILDEMREMVLDKLDASDKAAADDIMNSIAENLKKINDHGKRADAIVKGMLQHSRASTGEKKLTDINALVDDSLRLSYHGLKAKNKGLNINVKTDFDKNAGEVAVVPQDISRVILNLCNNAFYSVNQKKQTTDSEYEPTVLVTTKRSGDKVKISVRDNGNGVPKKILDKIFQPFFTTKPTGQGTGLGLSLSYDIIKFHDGELKVETEEGNFSEFTIELPVEY